MHGDAHGQDPSGRERILRSDHQKYGGATQSRTSEKNTEKAGQVLSIRIFAQKRSLESLGTLLAGRSPGVAPCRRPTPRP
jgi:hypothetical protein